MATFDVRPSNEHHALVEHEVLLLMQTDPERGLRHDEARSRRERYGANALPPTAGTSALRRLLNQLNNPLIYVLLVAGVVTAVLGEVTESIVIFGVVVVNAAVGYVQEAKAEAELDALRNMVRTSTVVRRDGDDFSIDSEELVPGDVVLVAPGDKVPADIRLLECVELTTDESALTGESEPVRKDEVVLAPATPVADRRNMVYSGTLVSSGSGVGVVIATGSATELGEIHRLVGAASPLATPLTRRLTWFSKFLTVLILVLAAATFAVGVARGEPGSDMFTAAVALAVGAIPEGLPAAVTITLAIGVGRMARRKAIIRRLPAVETLGSTTIICSDKTGTLTENQMTVRTIVTPAATYDVTGTGYAPTGDVACRSEEPGGTGDEALRWSLLAGTLCNDAAVKETDDGWAAIGDPTEAALCVVAAKGGYDADVTKQGFPRTDVLPFSSERMLMMTQHHDATRDATITLAKGSVDHILARCSHLMNARGERAPLDGNAVQDRMHAMANQGLRVLATAVLLDEPLDLREDGHRAFAFTGLVAMLDPPRPAAISSVESCHKAGIDVKMITGDHAATASAIAAQVGILQGTPSPTAVISGVDLDALPTDQFAERVEQASVFARVTPEQKLRLVAALQGREHVVAMTGDGVNDAPALRLADIGVAMGRGGTEVAKEASDMVLTDDDFASLEAAVEEGRGVFDNLIKFIVWTLPTNMAEGLVILAAIAAGSVLPISPVQILWINMTTAVLLGLMLAFEPKEPGIMARPPRDPRKPLLSAPLVVRIVFVSALLVGASSWLFHWELSRGASIDASRTAAINLFVTVEIFYLFACRSLTRSVWRMGWLSNPWVIGGIALQIVGQLALTYLPVMNTIFSTAPIGLDVWWRILLLALGISMLIGIEKKITGQRM